MIWKRKINAVVKVRIGLFLATKAFGGDSRGIAPLIPDPSHVRDLFSSTRLLLYYRETNLPQQLHRNLLVSQGRSGVLEKR